MDQLDDAALVAALRRGDGGAIAAFIARFHRLLLSYARRALYPDPDADVLVEEVLADVIMSLIQSDAVCPTHLAGYVVGAYRHRIMSARRARRRRERVELAVAEVAESTGQDAALPPVLQRLAAALSAELEPEERRLLAWVSEHVPQRVIGEWLGVSHAAVRKRVERLRARLRAASRRFETGLDQRDVDELHRFFRRAGGSSGAAERSREEVND